MRNYFLQGSKEHRGWLSGGLMRRLCTIDGGLASRPPIFVPTSIVFFFRVLGFWTIHGDHPLWKFWQEMLWQLMPQQHRVFRTFLLSRSRFGVYGCRLVYVPVIVSSRIWKQHVIFNLVFGNFIDLKSRNVEYQMPVWWCFLFVGPTKFS